MSETRINAQADITITTPSRTFSGMMADTVGWYSGRAVETFGPALVATGMAAGGAKAAMALFGSGAGTAAAGSLAGTACAPLLAPTVIYVASKIAAKSISTLLKSSIDEGVALASRKNEEKKVQGDGKPDSVVQLKLEGSHSSGDAVADVLKRPIEGTAGIRFALRRSCIG